MNKQIITDTEINENLARIGVTREQAELNLKYKFGYSDKKIREELEAGVRLQQLLKLMKDNKHLLKDFFEENEND